MIDARYKTSATPDGSTSHEVVVSAEFAGWVIECPSAEEALLLSRLLSVSTLVAYSVPSLVARSERSRCTVPGCDKPAFIDATVCLDHLEPIPASAFSNERLKP
jgi:hypothetical protein